MGTTQIRCKVGLEAARRRFDRWRQRHHFRSRLPESLWAAAIKLAGTAGLNRTAKALRLDYYSLKKRCEQASVAGPVLCAERGRPTFLELPAPVSAGGCECLMELENASGAKMRVHLKGIAVPDLAALSRSFWNLQS
jgi:hypothetical protein